MLAIVNGLIETMAGAAIPGGTVLIDGTTIRAAGREVEIPDGARILDAGGRLVTPGFIDAHSHIGMWEECVGFSGADGNELTDPITPHLRAIDGIYPMEQPFADACSGGVTAAATGPGSTNVIGGQFAAIKLAGHCIDDMVIKAPMAMKCALGENPKNYYNAKNMAPITRMGIAGMLRETLARTIDYMERKEQAGEDMLRRPAYDVKYEAMIPVVKKELPLKVHAHRADDILTAIRIAREFDLKITLDHCTEGHLIVEEIKRSGFGAIVGPSFGFKNKQELRNKTFETAAILAHSGVKVALMTDHPVHCQHDLPLFAGLAAKAGMTREEALRAVTINAAEIMGVDSRIGSLVPGKDADVVIWDGDPLSVDYRVYCTVVDGKVVYQAPGSAPVR